MGSGRSARRCLQANDVDVSSSVRIEINQQSLSSHVTDEHEGVGVDAIKRRYLGRQSNGTDEQSWLFLHVPAEDDYQLFGGNEGANLAWQVVRPSQRLRVTCAQPVHQQRIFVLRYR